MERIIALLREKNQCLEKFYWVNEQELVSLGVGNFETVESFYRAREKILGLISHIDILIDEENAKAPGPVTDELRMEVESILHSKDELVKAILGQDLQVLSFIEKEKSNIIRELKVNSTAKKAVEAYANSERLKHLEQE